MVLVIGEVLVDVFPEYRRIGGAPFNFAYHLKHLGIQVTFVSRIGDDSLGLEILDILKKNDFDTSRIQVDPEKPTGRVSVTPDQSGGHSFHIEPDSAYDYIRLPETPEELSSGRAVDLIYFGTLVQRTPSMFARVQDFLANRSPRTRCFYDINLRPDSFSDKIIKKSLEHTDILKLNEDEIEYIRKIFSSSLDTAEFTKWLMEAFGLRLLALTKGAEGSEIATRDDFVAAGPPPDMNIVDTVGAGDAYSAILAVGILKKWQPARILSMATSFASSICGIRGAVPETAAFYEPFIKETTGGRNG